MKKIIYQSLLVTVCLLFAGAFTVEKVCALTIIKQVGWLESAYVTWQPVSGAESYNVYYSGEGVNNKKIDTPLIRQYGDYWRADVPGLKAGAYTLTVKAVNSSDTEFESATTSAVTVLPHDRSGFAFSKQSPSFGTSSGAYTDEGVLRAGANVIYLTEQTATTVTLDVITNDKGTITKCTGIGQILTARQKGYDKTPLAIRLIGKVTAATMNLSDGALGSDNDLQIKGKGYTELNTTIEGIGDDATAYGWGILVRNCMNIEIRNIGFMDFPEDGVSLNTDNRNIWVHNCDFFYGQDKGGDKAKGDGSLDSKESGYTTFSYNHFWDAGKCNLLGNGTEDPEYLTYHHNWYDHSDSRHPRVRFHTVHVYNNYYDGNAKYGIGATRNSSIFSENNYFLNCKYPMLTSQQGTDVYNGAKGTFSSEDGGMIKEYNNHLEGYNRYVPYSQDNTDFDAYDATSRTQTIPNTVKTKKGSFSYNNFDTDEAITGAAVYPCTIDDVNSVPAKVRQYAGRIEGGDLKFTFTYSDNTLADDPVPAIANAIKNYESSLISIQGESNGGGGEPGGGGEEPGDAGGEGGNLCDIVAQGTSSGFAITGGKTSDSKGSVTVNGTSYSCCLKMESSTNISFTINTPKTLILVFLASEAGKKVKINGENQTIGAQGILEIKLAAGAHAITKGDTANLFYIALQEDNDTPTTIKAISGKSVYFNKGIIVNPENEFLQVYDTVGRLIISGSANLDLTPFAHRFYIVRIGNTSQVMKVIW
ncbi:MAG: pectate lyase [Dysgonamonadaceae bacterium]|nr:pectate lyase [Dysgonamonadaceae bacterium]